MKAGATSAWEVVPLGTLADFRNGVNYTKKSFGRGIKIINVKNFKDYSIASYDDLDEIDPDGVVRSDDVLRDNDIIFVRSNGNRELIGRSMFICAPRERVTHSAFTIRARFTSDRVLPRFFAYLFRSPLIRQTFSAKGGGTNISNLNQGILSSLEVSLPPLSVQESIVEVLSAYDDAIGNNTRRIEILEEMAHTIYREWFVHFRFPGREKVKLLDDSTHNRLPVGWETMTIGEFGNIVTGKTPSKDRPEYCGDHMPFVKTPDLHGKIFCLEAAEALSERGAATQQNKTIPSNSVCVSCIGTVGVVSITGMCCQTNQQINSIVLRDQSEREYLYFALLDLKETISQHGATGATMANLSKGKFEALKVSYPGTRLISSFHYVVFEMFEEIKLLQMRNSNLRRTRDILLPKVIAGEVPVDIPRC